MAPYSARLSAPRDFPKYPSRYRPPRCATSYPSQRRRSDLAQLRRGHSAPNRPVFAVTVIVPIWPASSSAGRRRLPIVASA